MACETHPFIVNATKNFLILLGIPPLWNSQFYQILKKPDKKNSVHPHVNLRFKMITSPLWEFSYIYNKCDKVQPYIYVVDDPWVQTVQHYFQLTINWLKGQVKVITRFTANLDPAFCKKKRKIFFSINQMWAVSLSCFFSWCRPLYTGSSKSLAALISSWADEDWGLNQIHLQNEAK